MKLSERVSNAVRALRGYNITITDDSGETRTEPLVRQDAASISWVYTCTDKRAISFAALPLTFCSVDDKGRLTPITDHPLAKLFSVSPYAGKELTTFDWVKYMLLQHDLHGNAYAQVLRNGFGDVVEVIPLDATAVTPERSRTDGKVYYTITAEGKPTKKLTTDQVLHIRNYAPDGLVGKGPIQMCREEFEQIVRVSATLRDFQENAMRIQDIITIPQNYSEKTYQQMRAYLAAKKKGEPLLMWQGWTHTARTTQLSAEDASFLTTMQFRASTIATLFHVPAYKLNLNNFQRPSSTTEQENLEWLNDVLAPMAAKWVAAMNMTLLRPEEQGKYTFNFAFNEANRGDIKTLQALAQSGITFGYMTTNEARELFDLPPVEDGDTLKKPESVFGREPTESTEEPTNISGSL